MAHLDSEHSEPAPESVTELGERSYQENMGDGYHFMGNLYTDMLKKPGRSKVTDLEKEFGSENVRLGTAYNTKKHDFSGMEGELGVYVFVDNWASDDAKGAKSSVEEVNNKLRP